MSDTFTDSSGAVRLRGTFVSGRQASALLTSADLLDRSNVERQLVAPPGAGLALWPTRVVWVYDFGGTPYTDNGGKTLVDWNPASPVQFQTLADSDLLDNGADGFAIQDVDTDGGLASAFVVGLGLYLFGIDADPTDGNGTLAATVYYDVLRLA